ncbi:MAG: hypothetical protein F6K40_26200 [Okeania sp. SIO3I5]|uniref:hypothetical protein n=1 Tax=Okeania sp. SIO3I5 TaxID=2607805 RepID=UPI0013B96951|nr:hypothetical protein [Okeania sp. SIO3I5]NEQ39557.1 hypothetical protein [Okeania sp. SIO3I5]
MECPINLDCSLLSDEVKCVNLGYCRDLAEPMPLPGQYIEINLVSRDGSIERFSYLMVLFLGHHILRGDTKKELEECGWSPASSSEYLERHIDRNAPFITNSFQKYGDLDTLYFSVDAPIDSRKNCLEVIKDIPSLGWYKAVPLRQNKSRK